MRIRLRFGNIDLPYVNQADGRKVEGVTTIQVANWLENKYHIYTHFFEIEQPFLAHTIEQSVADALEALLMGAPPTLSPFAATCTQVEARFKAFIEGSVLEGFGYPGIPTKAALDGVKNGKVTGKRRPSFFDTGLYKATFKCWVPGYA